MPIILGYHGCDTETAQVLLGGSPFRLSEQKWDWLGSGAYFWEWDARRAYDWAKEYRPDRPSIVGAAVELGNCLDLTTQRGILAVEGAYRSYVFLQQSRGAKILENKDVNGRRPGNLALRFLDRAVITHLHEDLGDAGVGEYDTLRALFPEGEQLYPNAGFWKNTHVQVAVRNVEQIKGVFRIPAHELLSLDIPETIYNFT